MRFCIVSPPTVTEFSREVAETEAVLRLAEHAPVGILTLAAVLERLGRIAEIVDLNVIYYDYIREQSDDRARLDFCAYATERLLEKNFDVIGFGTICSSYPLTLRIAEAVRRARPNAPIVLGGPQASAVDISTLSSFPQIDYILRYEAEDSLPALLDALENGGSIEAVKGLTYRADGKVVRTPSAPVIANLDDLPIPAYHRYPYLEKARFIPLELGRGCPYACTFCSTNDFFRRTFRLKSPELIVEQMVTLKTQFNIATFDLIHDMFTVNRKKVVAFCKAIINSGERFYWNCSARTDRVDQELLELMAEAGCRGIFFGIETGSQVLQTTLKKRLVLSDAMEKIRAASELGMQTAVSLITGFPTETDQDFADTTAFFARALRYENSIPQLHILAPLADTPIEREHRSQLHFDDIVSDMSHQGWNQESADRDLISRYPEVFSSFYAVPTGLNRQYVKEVRAFLLYGGRRFRWMLSALHQEAGHILTVYDDFRIWLEANRSSRFEVGEDLTPYYQREEFAADFPDFVRDTYLDRLEGGPPLAALLEFSTAFDDVRKADEATHSGKGEVSGASSSRQVVRTRQALTGDSVPVLEDPVRLVKTDFDFQALMAALIDGRPLREIPRERKTLASRVLPGHQAEVLQLSPSSLSLLELCDGTSTVDEIIQRFTRMHPRSDDIPPAKAAFVGLEILRHDSLIAERSPAPAAPQAAAGAALVEA